MQALASKVTNIKSIISDKVEDEDSTAVAPTGRQIAISRLTGRGGSLFRFNDPGTRGNNSTSLSKYNFVKGKVLFFHLLYFSKHCCCCFDGDVSFLT